MSWQLREAGDSALLFQLEPVIDPDVNARVIAIANGIRERALLGVRDVVSTFHSVAVYFDPLIADLSAIAAALHESATTPSTAVSGRCHEIPVCYGGEDGPDLEALASHAGLTSAEVIERHAGIDYRVFMLGFQPGFAYLGLVDPAIAMPRRAFPRLNVPARSVGIAGRQTGIYPSPSPGGWQIIGRALAPVFDQEQTPPALFAPGDSVRFMPVQTRDVFSRDDRRAGDAPDQNPVVTVLRPGLFTTIQDAGRWGQQGIGVTVGGPMDPVSHAAANRVVGNPPDAHALEVTIGGPELRVEHETTIAVAGADLSATLNGSRLDHQEPVTCQSGHVVSFGQRMNGARAYVAFAGGVQPHPRFPGPLIAGQRIGSGVIAVREQRTVKTAMPMPCGGARLRVLPGPQQDQLPSTCLDALCSGRFIVSPQSNRVGYRLAGRVLPSPWGEMISDATFAGAIQVPPSGEPILLMADRRTTGGYPQVAIVITADLPLAGQLAPGDWIEFVVCSLDEARAALAAQEAMLADVR